MRARAGSGIATKWIVLLCFASFIVGTLFTNRMWQGPDSSGGIADEVLIEAQRKLESNGEPCDSKPKPVNGDQKDILSEVSKTHMAIRTLDKTISSLEMELAAARAAQATSVNGSPILDKPVGEVTEGRQKAFVVIGINTAFSSRKRRDSVRETWMPQGDKLKQLEQEKGIVIRFVIGHSATPGGILDRAIEAEDAQHNDFLRLEHVEGYHELSAKTKIYFSTAVSKWDADFYVKVDDDVHVNLGMLGTTLARHRSKPRVYIGCMKSGPVLAQKGVKYHEPEFWKFGEEGNKYFRHATGQIYAISKDLATYISINQPILHRYANEDVSLGSWFIGLDVEHIDDRSMCCGTPPDCEWKAQAGNVCVASFDWACSGICKSVERIKDVHQRCGEGEGACQLFRITQGAQAKYGGVIYHGAREGQERLFEKDWSRLFHLGLVMEFVRDVSSFIRVLREG
ncbi:hypothetical protein AXG93_2153s1060 [Marchantia polymorpha subsp. ruderalis]|uniref:Hexosyltransferase n=1 Tax=Marchantia polymorpha subsp. ruderalis TaxID=1480154 RepID=A0A176WJN6_MARPO|nr:hypothetical protein AXG93_2153s1060 [Marchantia polymorpha subsp. ruderalis]